MSTDYTPDSTPDAFSSKERKVYEFLVARIARGNHKEIGVMRMQLDDKDVAVICAFKPNSQTGVMERFAPLYVMVTDEIASRLTYDDTGRHPHAPQEHMVPGAEALPVEPSESVDLTGVSPPASA